MAVSLKAVASDTSAREYIPYESHLTSHIIRLESEHLLFVMKLEGAAHESADESTRNTWHESFCQYLRSIASENVAVWSHVVRRPYGRYPEGEFEAESFAQAFDTKYRTLLSDKQTLVNELYVSILYRRPKAEQRFFKKLASREDLERDLNEDIATIGDLMIQSLEALDRYEPRLLGMYTNNKGRNCSEVLEFLAFLIDGDWKTVTVPTRPIRDHLGNTRFFFNSTGRIASSGLRDLYGNALTIMEYPSVTYPGLLDDVLSLPFEFVLAQSFTFLNKPTALSRLKRQEGRMVNAGDLALSQIEELTEAMDDVMSNRYVLGAHSLSFIIRTEDPKVLSESVAKAGSALADAGMKWVREDLGCAGALWSSLPGNFKYRVRIGDITSRNFARLASLHNYPTGHIDRNPWGPAVTMFKTTSGAPYYFNFHQVTSEDRTHASVDPDHKALANTIVIGKSGTGKTVLEMVLLAQVQKFNQPEKGKKLSCVVFDKDLGASIGVRAMGGKYLPIKNGVPSGFNPFQLEPTPKNLAFLDLLVRQLLQHPSYPITPRQEQEIHDAVEGVMGAPRELRRLSAVLQFLNPTDEQGLHVRLSRWCQGGALGWLFDNPKDTLAIDDDVSIVGFDVTEFLDNPETRTPTIMYLFHRIEKLIDGRRIPIFMDEFWKLLDDPAFEDLIMNKLVTIRKQDGFLVMFTQNPQQVLRSKAGFAVVSQTATKIFLPNPEADRKGYVEGFGLTESEYQIVKTLSEKSRKFLIKQGHNSVIAELNLSGFEDELAVLSGNTASSILVERLISERGNSPKDWLPEFQRLRKGDGSVTFLNA
jgi:type IV secretion system protein VirB4